MPGLHETGTFHFDEDGVHLLSSGGSTVGYYQLVMKDLCVGLRRDADDGRVNTT
ncbi:hypothetical protein GCM10023196_076050 [Actinoallomurus vinaceus]|uniref:Uncharacterized protein n=1 Tax=Actinoallomurus vinaceus TaxID=1080074 RepID=A0ABP8UQ80_9ACTN